MDCSAEKQLRGSLSAASRPGFSNFSNLGKLLEILQECPAAPSCELPGGSGRGSGAESLLLSLIRLIGGKAALRTLFPFLLTVGKLYKLLSQGSLDLDVNTDGEQTRSLTGACGKPIDFSKMCTSNEEYYLKLEELKNAHVETMAKLESMYRNKLYLKGLQPSQKKNAASAGCCR